VVVTPSVTFVVLYALRDGRTLWDQAGELPRYLSDTFLHGDMGLTNGSSPLTVKHLVLHGLPIDLALLAGGIVAGVGAGLAAGLLAGARPRGAADRGFALGSALALSVPVYLFSNVALFIFAPGSGTTQISFFSATDAYVPLRDDPLRWLQAMWVPWVVLAVPLGALVYRLTRSVLFEVSDDLVLRTARAKGVSERRVQRRHALPLAVPAVLGLVSANVALMITNIALIEPAFNLPGAFRYADVGQFRSAERIPGSPPVSPPLQIVQALIVESAFLIAGTMLVCDLLQARLDPRVRGSS
jgi:peptide/nickel transport system permease protein